MGMMQLHADSHVDHGLSPAQLQFLLERFSDRDAFLIETVDLPPEFGTVPCTLAGPILGELAVPEQLVVYRTRGSRTWASRCVIGTPRQVRMVTVIAGPHDGHACVLFTAYGGPLAPQEPDDPGCKDVPASKAFWREHAIVVAE